MLHTIKKIIRSGIRRDEPAPTVLDAPPKLGPVDNETYWTSHNVTNHQQFATVAQSLAYFNWRNDQYPGYIDLMPVSGQDGKVVLDYGCGPGNDLIGFGHFSKPAKLIGMDISSSSLRESEARLALHGVSAHLIHLKESAARLPLEDASVDYVHSSGVVQCTEDPVKVLREMRRVIRPNGRARIMVYNYDSLWVHLYVAYVLCIKENRYPGMDVRSAFAVTTDGENCPISRVYTPTEFCQLAAESGFRCEFIGAAVSLIEMTMMAQRFEAAQRLELAEEHRKFLLSLTLDSRGFPMIGKHYAGIDGCFELFPA